MDNIDQSTGEILSDDDELGVNALPTQAADGGLVARRSGHVSDVLRMLEEGQFNADVSDEMRGLAEALKAHAANNKGSAKGSLTIKLDFSMANGLVVVTPSSTVKKPVQKRDGTALFLGDNNSLGRNPPNQAAMFGDRAPRDDWANENQQVREV
jgi:hypothetical protein